MKFILISLLVAVAYAHAETYAADDDVEVEMRCDTATCMNNCRALGWHGGRCSGATCLCYRFKTDDLAFDSHMASCDNRYCDRKCWSSGWLGGYCNGDTCVCEGRPWPSLLHIASSAQHEMAGPSSRMAYCEAKNCWIYCQGQGKRGGKCVGGRCICCDVC